MPASCCAASWAPARWHPPRPASSAAPSRRGAEAARNYSEGLERLRTFDTLAARDLLRNAVTAAPEHALSHAALAAAVGPAGL